MKFTVYIISDDEKKGTVSPHIIENVQKDAEVKGSATTPELTINGVKVTATPKEGYKFEKWDGFVEKITQDTTLTATWKPTVEFVTVTWENWDGTVLETDYVPKDTKPEYKGATPERESENPHDEYLFTGWDPEPEKVTKDTTYRAEFALISKIQMKYTDGSEPAIFDTENTQSLVSVDLGLTIGLPDDLCIIYIADDDLTVEKPKYCVGDVFRIGVGYDGELLEYDFDAEVTFLITADDMAEHPEWKANPENFVLYHYKDGEWKSLTTTYYNDMEGNYFFTAITDGFSPFAIGYVENQPTPSSGGSSTTTFNGGSKNGDTFTFDNAVVVKEVTLPGATSAKITNTSGSGWYNFELTAPGFTGNGSMQFEVPLDVLEVKGATTGDVGLYHKENGEWVLKPTTLLLTDSKTAYYKATFDSCSPFMIDITAGASSSGTAAETKKEDTTKTEEKTEKTDTSGTAAGKTSETQKTADTTKKTEEKAKSPFPVLGILAGLGAAALMIRRK